MAKVESGKGSKTSERRPPKKKEGSPAPQAMDEGSEESKFNPRLRETYLQKVVPALMKEFGYKNVMQVPKLERIVLNVGMGEAIQNVKLFESAAGELGAITGQKPLITKAKKAIAAFKLRQGMPIGTKVTLRSRRMWEFFDRLVILGIAEDSRLPRYFAEVIRWAWELYAWTQRTAHLPRDQVRRGRIHPWNGYHDCHDRQDQR